MSRSLKSWESGEDINRTEKYNTKYLQRGRKQQARCKWRLKYVRVMGWILSPHKIHMLKSSPSELQNVTVCGGSLYRGDSVQMKSLHWALIQKADVLTQRRN